jgi:GMP reductase
MTKLKKQGYSFKDVTIVPSATSTIRSRSEIINKTSILNSEDSNQEFYPIFVSPMSSIIDHNNYKTFRDSGVMPVIPRVELTSLAKRIKLMHEVFVAFSIEEARNIFIDNNPKIIKGEDFNKGTSYICIDVADGHMQHLLDLIEDIKNKYHQHVIVMSGNIANPQTYKKYCKIHCDYIRVSIGSGSGCTTACNTGVYYPIASLISEIYDIKVNLNHKDFQTKIVADGGISNFDDINKALALGADFVMIGNLFARTEEACGREIMWKDMTVEQKVSTLKMNPKLSAYLSVDSIADTMRFREYYGMSTKLAQQKMNSNAVLKTSEGIIGYLPIEYSLKTWIDNMDSYMRSAMSYTEAYNLEYFIGQPEIIINAGNTRQSFIK